MNQQQVKGYKKFKTMKNEPVTTSQWDSYSKNKPEQSSFRRKTTE